MLNTNFSFFFFYFQETFTMAFDVQWLYEVIFEPGCCLCRSGMKGWPCLRRKEQHRVTQTPSLYTPHLFVMWAGTHTFLCTVSTRFLASSTLGLRRGKIFSTWVGSVEKMPPVSTTHRYQCTNCTYVKVECVFLWDIFKISMLLCFLLRVLMCLSFGV